MSDAKVYRCRASVYGKPCTFEGGNEAAGEHWRETGHGRCVCCGSFLAHDERQTCLKCVGSVRTDLLDIVDCVASAPDAMRGIAWRGLLPVELLAYVGDGAIESSVQQLSPAGSYRGVEWPSDPWPVVAVLESLEREWRHDFGHGPNPTVATVSGCADYLTTYLPNAAKFLASFDDDASTLHTLASRLRHAVGQADDPMMGVDCFDCGSVLTRSYRPPVWPVGAPREGTDAEGLEDLWTCSNRRCRRVYEPAEYYLAVRAKLEAEAMGA